MLSNEGNYKSYLCDVRYRQKLSIHPPAPHNPKNKSWTTNLSSTKFLLFYTKYDEIMAPNIVSYLEHLLICYHKV